MAGGQSVGKIISVSGVMTVTRPGQQEPVRLSNGDVILVGDAVQSAAASGGQVELTDDSFMNLGAGAAVRINQFSFNESTNRRTSVVKVIGGQVRFVVYVVRSPESFFRVETETASIFVDDLADIVVESAQDRTNVSVLERTIRVRNALPYIVGETRLGINQKATVFAKKPPSVPGVVAPEERRRYLRELSK